MVSIKTEGIILSVKGFQESDKLVKIFSKDLGILDCIAKGAKKITSRKSSNIEILNYADFYLADSKSLKIIQEIKLKSDVTELSNIDNYILFYFAEVLLRALSGDSYHQDFYTEVLTIRENLKNHLILLLKLQLLVLDELGNLPELSICIDTSEDLTTQRFWNNSDIGFRKSSTTGEEISDRILKIQLFLIRENLRNITKLKIQNDEFKKIFSIQNRWIELAMDSKINSFRFIK